MRLWLRTSCAESAELSSNLIETQSPSFVVVSSKNGEKRGRRRCPAAGTTAVSGAAYRRIGDSLAFLRAIPFDDAMPRRRPPKPPPPPLTVAEVLLGR
jgi:hypothetical protein